MTLAICLIGAVALLLVALVLFALLRAALDALDWISNMEPWA